MTAGRRQDLLALAILTSLITVLFADVLLGINSFYLRDLSHYYYPAKHVLREIVLGGEFPSWNPWFSAGQPLAANPEHEVFYPLTWLILLPSFRFGFHLLLISHLYIAAFTMYALLRSMRVSAVSSFFGALSFVLGGLCLSYLNLTPCLFAVAWLPLACLYTRRFLQEPSGRSFALASLAFGITLLVGEPTTILQIGILLGLYAAYLGWRRRRVLTALGFVAAISLAALLVGAVQILPAIDHAGDSVRSRGFTFADVTDWSLPPARVAELFYPNVFGHLDLHGQRLYWGRHAYGARPAPFLLSIYPGLLITVVALAGVFARVRGWPLVVTIGAVSLLIAFGSHTPLWRILYDSGLARSLRYPEKFALMAQFAVIVFGARTLDELLGGNARVRRAALVIAVVTVIAAAIGALLAFAPFSTDPVPALIAAARNGWLVAMARGALLIILLRNVVTVRRPLPMTSEMSSHSAGPAVLHEQHAQGLANQRRRPGRLWIGIAGTFLLLDLSPQFSALAPRIPSAFYEAPPLASQLPPDRRDWRLFHHADWHKSRPEVVPYFIANRDQDWLYRNGMFPHVASLYGIRTALEGDYDRTALLPTEDFQRSVIELSNLRPDWLEVAASMSNVWYRAVFIAPREAFARSRGDRQLTQPVGILPLEHAPRYSFADRVESIQDRNDFVRKVAGGTFGKHTAFVSGVPSFVPAPGQVLGVGETANTVRLAVQTRGRAFLVISVTPHKYWNVTIDGRPVPAFVTNVGYQGVVVPTGGRHVIEMKYRNPLIVAGGACSAASILLLLWIALRSVRWSAAVGTTTMRAL